MSETLNIYIDGKAIKSSEYIDGKANVTIDGLEPNTEYRQGTFQVTRQTEHGESDKVDVPTFKTKAISVTGVKLDQHTLTLSVGGTTQLKASISPSTATDKSVTYHSSNNEIVTVDGEGNVTAIADGSADIEVVSNDGNKKDACTVTVEKETPEEPDNVEVESNKNDANVSAE